MKRYETPEIVVVEIQAEDVITTSRGDTPNMDHEW